jgi:metacaspase-1
MANGLGLFIHMDRVDPAAYDGTWSGNLGGPVNDARIMADLVRSANPSAALTTWFFPGQPEDGTRAGLLGALDAARDRLSAGDTLIVTYSGHGGTIPDIVSGTEPVRNTLCLYDGMLVDVELAHAWSTFRSGVRIVMIADSCHSGSIARLALAGGNGDGLAGAAGPPARARGKFSRAAPRDVCENTYRLHQADYDAIQMRNWPEPTVAASVLQLAACEDGQESIEYDNGQFQVGLYTDTLRAVMTRAAAPPSYGQLEQRLETEIARVIAKFGGPQVPALLQFGAADPDLHDRIAPLRIS